MLCSKLHCQKRLSLILFSYENPGSMAQFGPAGTLSFVERLKTCTLVCTKTQNLYSRLQKDSKPVQLERDCEGSGGREAPGCLWRPSWGPSCQDPTPSHAVALPVKFQIRLLIQNVLNLIHNQKRTSVEFDI